MRCTYTTIVVVGVFVFAFVTWSRGFPETSNEWIAILVGSAGGGVGAMIAGFLISLVTIVLSGSKSNGVLGEHEYEITSDGLFERTAANEGVSRWSGIEEVRVCRSYALFRISGYLFHIIPKRSFESEQQFNEFVQKAKHSWEHAYNE